MPLALTLVTPPTIEPMTLDEAKAYLRVDGTDEDALIDALLLSAREEVEVQTGRQLLTATYALRLPAFSAMGCIKLPRPPLQSITSVTYYDSANVLQTLAASVYQVNVSSDPGRIALASGQSWPSTYGNPFGEVIITYVAGYTAATLPERARTAVKLILNDTFEHRESQLEARVHCNETVKRLLWSLRIVDFV